MLVAFKLCFSYPFALFFDSASVDPLCGNYGFPLLCVYYINCVSFLIVHFYLRHSCFLVSYFPPLCLLPSVL